MSDQEQQSQNKSTSRRIRVRFLESILSRDKRLNAAFDRMREEDIQAPKAENKYKKRKHGRPSGGKVIFDQARINKLPEIGYAAEFARVLNVKLASVQQWCEAKKNPLPCIREDGHVMMRKDVVIKWFISTGRLKVSRSEHRNGTATDKKAKRIRKSKAKPAAKVEIQS